MDNTLRQILGALIQVTSEAEDLAKQLQSATQELTYYKSKEGTQVPDPRQPGVGG